MNNHATLDDVHGKIVSNPQHWAIALMEFVDDFRVQPNLQVLNVGFTRPIDRWATMLASTAIYLCEEKALPVPDWLYNVPACKKPWFVSGLDNLKAISFVESPLAFRMNKIFVLNNFLSRV